MTPEQFADKMKTIRKELLPDCAEIIAETATEYFQNSFTRKAFDGHPWRRTHKTTGSTLIESGNLMNSIRPITVTEKEVVIAAGNEKVAYARVHNEGGVQYVKPHHRTRKSKRPGEADKRSQVKGYAYKAWKRQFMGDSKEMFDIIDKRISEYIKSLNK